MKTHTTIGSAIALLALLATSAQAAVLVDFKMTADGQGLASALSVAPTTSNTNITVSGLLNQAGQATTGSNNFNAGTDRVSIWTTALASSGNVTYANAFSTGNYVTFSVTANAGFSITLDSISFQVAAATSSATANRAFHLVSETSPGAFSALSTVLESDSTPNAGGAIPLQAANPIDTVPADYSVSLASLGVINEGETRHFRFYLQTDTASQGIAFDDIVLNGTVAASAIPEPSALALLAGVGGLGVAALRRRRR
ncbi:MAG: PEP-CTERM sorting domain-containing protein [Verrucomicrobiota bacterium]